MLVEILLMTKLIPNVGNLMGKVLLPLEDGLQTILEFLGVLVGLLEGLLHLHQSEGKVKDLVRLECLGQQTHSQRVLCLIIVLC